MLRVADMISMIQSKPSINYEYEAALEYYTKGGKEHYAQTMPQYFGSQLNVMEQKKKEAFDECKRSLPHGVKNDNSWATTQTRS